MPDKKLKDEMLQGLKMLIRVTETVISQGTVLGHSYPIWGLTLSPPAFQGQPSLQKRLDKRIWGGRRQLTQAWSPPGQGTERSDWLSVMVLS